jgi:ABC-2 type transport system permease protein
LNQYLYQDTKAQKFALSTFLGANLLLSVMERSNLNVMMGFLEDVWAKNIGNILISPIRTGELIIGVIINGFIGMTIGVSFAFLVANITFDYNVFSLGMASLGFLSNLILTGWAIGLIIIAVIFYFGMGAEMVGWMTAFLILPFVCVYYPVEVLPKTLQMIAWSLPPTYTFEGLRYWIHHDQFNWTLFYKGLALNGVFLILGVSAFVFAMNRARNRGGLLSMGE